MSKYFRGLHSAATRIAFTAVVAAVPLISATSGAQAAPVSFYKYEGPSLDGVAPGTVLKSRTFPYHPFGIGDPITAIQLQYRTTDALGRATMNVTSVLRTAKSDPGRAVAYGSFYDSLNPADTPSRNIRDGRPINGSEFTLVEVLLSQGYTVIVSDIEGQPANFGAGPVYGINTLDSIRAASRSPETGLSATTRVGMLGYSGGAIATGWAAALAPRYAPDVNARLVGAAQGGVLVNPMNNLTYVGGSLGWAGIAPMALTGIARAYDIDLTPYLNHYGNQVIAKMRRASTFNVMFQYPGLTWQQLAKPQYVDPMSIPPVAAIAPKIDLGLAPTPTIPLQIGQGANGILEGTPPGGRGIGPGDGVMVAGDVRGLVQQYCAAGNRQIQYIEYGGLSHALTTVAWSPGAVQWMADRFAGIPAPTNCGAIPPGNPTTPR